MAGRLPTEGKIQGQGGANRKIENKCRVVLVQGPWRDVVGGSRMHEQRSGKQEIEWEAGIIDKPTNLEVPQEET